MSMLAERKIKQKWSLNPRGKAWSEGEPFNLTIYKWFFVITDEKNVISPIFEETKNSNKFGQKMLEKMGWSKGKGLGPKENGMTEHLKISYKNDSKGMGYKETNDQWTEHDEQFNTLLENLSGEKPKSDSIKLSSLEEKSQNSKVRLHYKKFTRGKDLSKCTEKDLANIFGKKSLNASKNEDPKEIKEPEEKNTSDFTLNGGSMRDYFKKKLPNFGKSKGYVVGNNGVLKQESDSEEESKLGFGRKRKSTEDTDCSIPNKKKKKKNKNEDQGLTNPAFDPLFAQIKVEKHTLNTIEEEDESKLEDEIKDDSEDSGNASGEIPETQHKQKKKKKTNLEHSEVIEIEETVQTTKEIKMQKNKKSAEEATELQHDPEAPKKKKKKKRDVSPFDNPNFEDIPNNQSSLLNEQFEVKRKKKKEKSVSEDSKRQQNDEEVKMKKKAKIVDSGIDNPNTENFMVNEDQEIKKKKKRNIENCGIENPNFDAEAHESNLIREDYEVKRKKKRKNSEAGVDNPNFTIEDTEANVSNNGFEVKRKKKKIDALAIDNPNFDDKDNTQRDYVDSNFEVKRKKKKSKNLAGDNPNFEDTSKTSTTEDTSIEPTLDLVLNVSSTPVPPTPPSKSSLKRRKSVRFSDINQERSPPIREAQPHLNGSLEEISKKIEGFQAEVENDINERKDQFIGEVGSSNTTHEKLENGTTKLGFKTVKFNRSPHYLNRGKSGPKASYKHLIRGDIILHFKNTNLHEIEGYGVKGIK